MSVSDQEDCPFSFGPGTNNYLDAVYHNDQLPSVDNKYQSPKRSGRTESGSARSRLSSLNPLSSRSCRLLKDPLPPITRQSSIASSSSEVSADPPRHCGHLNYPVFKPPCFEHSTTEKKSLSRNKDDGDGRHSDESDTNTRYEKGEILHSGNCSNRTGSSPINFGLLYNTTGSQNGSLKYVEHDDVSDSSKSSDSKISSKKDYEGEEMPAINPDFRSFWDITGRYQAGDSTNTSSLQVLSLGIPQSAGGKSDADSILDSGSIEKRSARMRRREKTRSSFSTTISPTTISPCAQSPAAISSMSSPRSPCVADLDSGSSKSNETDYGAQIQRALRDFKRIERIEKYSTENIEDVLKSYRSVNSDLIKDTQRSSQGEFRKCETSSPSYSGDTTADKIIVTADVHSEYTPTSLVRSSSLIFPKKTIIEKQSPSPRGNVGSPRRAQPHPNISHVGRSLPASAHRGIDKCIKLPEKTEVQSARLGRQPSIKMGLKSIKKSHHRETKANVTTVSVKDATRSKLITSKEIHERKPLAKSARYSFERSPRLSVKKPEVHSAKFPPYWPEVRTQFSAPTIRKESSPGSLSSRSKSPSPHRYKDNLHSCPNVYQPKKIRVPSFPRSLDSSPKKLCPLTSRSLQIQKIEPPVFPRTCFIPPLNVQEHEANFFDLRLKLPPSPPPPSPPVEDEAEAFPPDPNWIRSEPYPGCVQYCPVSKQYTNQIGTQVQEHQCDQSELSPFESSTSSKQSKKIVLNDVDEIFVEPRPDLSCFQYEKNDRIFQQKKHSKHESLPSPPATAESRKSNFLQMSESQDDFKMANTWFENEIHGTGADLGGANWRDDTMFNNLINPVSVAKAVASTVLVENTAPSHVSYNSNETVYAFDDSLSLETVPESRGFCGWMASLCSSIGTKWFSES